MDGDLYSPNVIELASIFGSTDGKERIKTMLWSRFYAASAKHEKRRKKTRRKLF